MSKLRRFSGADRGIQDPSVGRPACHFLNDRSERFRLSLVVRRELGIVARVALVFSRRGLDIDQFALERSKTPGSARIVLEFYGSRDQLRAVYSDLSKLVDVEAIQESTLSGANSPVAMPSRSLEATF